jgi:hypothetical protein
MFQGTRPLVQRRPTFEQGAVWPAMRSVSRAGMEVPKRSKNDVDDDKRGTPGAEGGDSDAADKPPAAPADDSSPLGDTDQHSEADA